MFSAAHEGLVGLEQGAGGYRKFDVAILRKSHDPLGVRNFRLSLRELDDEVGFDQHDHDSTCVPNMPPLILSRRPEVTNI